MGRLDLPDVRRDEDDTYEDSSVDSPLNGAERQGTRLSSGATEERACDNCGQPGDGWCCHA